MSKTPKDPIGCAKCPRKWESRAGFGKLLHNGAHRMVCPVCKAQAEADRARSA